MQFLSTLQVQQKNKGVSTGTKWLASKGAAIDSYSPVDGKIIASVKSADKESYEAVLQQAPDW
jgi:aldehyde dehydrogenase (NAD+)